MEGHTATMAKRMMFLPKDIWSPRYDSTFYTVKIEGKELLSEAPQGQLQVNGKTNLPAYYYTVVVYREHGQKSVARRYSEFKWLYDQVTKYPPPDEQDPNAQAISMPPGTCFQSPNNDEFAQIRLEQLSDFLDDVLGRPGYANHVAVVQFLQLES